MLRSFRFANHRSFRDQQELLLLPVYEKESRPGSLTVAGLYGANASGKSNVLDAFEFMVTAVRDSYRRWDPDDRISRKPFRLRPEAADEPSWFEVDAVVEGVRYVYGFGLSDTEVVEEWLHSYPRGKKRNLFTRADGAVEFGGSVTGHKSALEGLTRPNALMLSMAAHVGLEMFLPVYRWFRRAVHVVDPDADLSLPSAYDYWMLTSKSPEFAEHLTGLIGAADVGISEIRIEMDPQATDPRYQIAEIIIEARDIAYAHYDALRKATDDGKTADQPTKHLLQMAQSRFLQALNASEDALRAGPESQRGARLQFIHAGGTAFPLEDESRGTLTWFGLVWAALRSLQEGGVLVVDELDGSLHPLLTAKLIGLFQSAESNPHHAQLIFTAHDTSLLGTALGRDSLHRDEVWFVEKAPDGASKLFPLTEFRPRQGENAERRYLGGSYGAVPVLDDQAFERGRGALPA